MRGLIGDWRVEWPSAILGFWLGGALCFGIAVAALAPDVLDEIGVFRTALSAAVMPIGAAIILGTVYVVVLVLWVIAWWSWAFVADWLRGWGSLAGEKREKRQIERTSARIVRRRRRAEQDKKT